MMKSLYLIGNKRHVEMIDKEPPYYINSNYDSQPTTGFIQTFKIDKSNDNYITCYINSDNYNTIPIYYPENTQIILLKDNMNLPKNNPSNPYYQFKDNMPYDNNPTRPFLHNVEWYTKVYYRSTDNNIIKFKNILGKNKSIINNLNNDSILSQNKNIYSTSDLFIHSMKGMRIPFIC